MIEGELDIEIQKAKESLKKADALLITAGAGMGVDSGLPDFRGKEGFWRAYPIVVFTSNVDGQFQKAGYDERRIVEIHGSIHYLQCSVPCSRDIWSADKVKVKVDMEKFEALEPLPKCRNCFEIARPNILMFGDWEWISDRTDDQIYLYDKWLSSIRKNGYKLAIVEIGAGKAVPTVRYQSEEIAERFGATLIRINPRDYDVPYGHISILTVEPVIVTFL